MALIDQRLDEKAVDEKSLMQWVNNQLRPVVRKMRDVVNARAGGYYAESVGDGVTGTFDIKHSLGSRDVLVQAYEVATNLDVPPASIERVDADTVRVTFIPPPPATRYRVLVRL